MQAPEYRTRRERADEFNIQFLGPVTSCRWPETHSRLFEDVQKLGKQEFAQYRESISVDSIEKPWRARVSLRAKRLAAMGFKYRDEGHKEKSWRLNVEPEVFQRFSFEVVCSECRSRLWEAEFNAAVDDLEPFAEALKRRRSKRTACECPEQMGSNIYEPGINMIFSNRTEEAIKHVPPLPIKKAKKDKQDKEVPDRIYGLNKTGDFNFILNSAAKSDPSKRLRDTIEISPFFQEREPLLFPFLIMEAKSSRQGDSAAVEMQTAFCIRRLLLLQHNLKEKTAHETQWKTGPLVWFFHWCGERWTIAGCFVENVHGNTHCSIVDLWSGDIRYENGAIQLLLIVDYIFDWARDIYRRSILNELNILASDDIADMNSVADIYSTIERSVSAWVDETGREHASQASNSYEQEATESISESLNLVHPEGVVRDASIIESKFLALHITEDDAESFLLSFPTAESSYKAIHVILQYMQDAWRIDAGTLHDLETYWTSDDNDEQKDRGYFNSQEIFYARIVILMYIGPEWQPVRQITYLAVSESALKLLASKVAANSTSSAIESIIKTASKSSIPKHALLRHIDIFKKHSIIDNLTAAVHTLCLSSTVQRRAGKIKNEFLLTRRRTAPFFGFVPDSSPGVLDLVTTVYASHRIGRKQSSDPYIRYSCLKTKQTRQYGSARMWSLVPLFVHRKGCILVDGLHQSEGIPKRCLYSIDGLSEINFLPDLLEQMSQEGCYYSTMPLDLMARCGDYFGFLNQPPRPTEFWKLKRDPQSIAVWAEFLKSQESRKPELPPTVIILDDEPVITEPSGEDMDIL